MCLLYNLPGLLLPSKPNISCCKPNPRERAIDGRLSTLRASAEPLLALTPAQLQALLAECLRQQQAAGGRRASSQSEGLTAEAAVAAAVACSGSGRAGSGVGVGASCSGAALLA